MPVVSKPSFALIKMKRITFFSQTKEEFKQERYLNLHNFNNRNALTEITLSSHNFAINTTKQYNLHSITFDRKHLTTSNIKLQIGNKVKKLKLFFAEGSFKLLTLFGQFSKRAFECRYQTVEIRRNWAHQKWFEEVAKYLIFQFSKLFSLIFFSENINFRDR